MSEWISVEDRMPEEDVLVLAIGKPYRNRPRMYCMAVYTYNHEGLMLADQTFGMFNPVNVDVDFMNDDEDNGVTHWQPLPEPPK